jgi:SAM-dependent methyltransferase
MPSARTGTLRAGCRAAVFLGGASIAFAAGAVVPVRWADLVPAVQRRLAAAGINEAGFGGFRQKHVLRTRARVQESDLDAAVYYALQSTAFTQDAPIEPAESARMFVEGLDDGMRQRFLAGSATPATDRVPASARRRLRTFASAIQAPPAGSRLALFHDVLDREAGNPATVEAALVAQYIRAMRFLYEKEFVAGTLPDSTAGVAALYRNRPLSTDTSVEAGYLVHLGLAMVQTLEPDRRIRRVLLVGPGLDLAPRTGLLELGPPQSYQPFAVIDALVALGLAQLDALEVIGADVNDRVVTHLHDARTRNDVVSFATGIGDGGAVTLTDEYRRYITMLGRASAEALAAPTLPAGYAGHLAKTLRFRPTVQAAIDGLRLDIVSDRLSGDRVDLVVATNIFPYLDDVELTLALANIAAILAPGGLLLHNEARPLVGDVTNELELPLTHTRTATLATVRGSATPLYDRVFIHVNRRAASAR